MRRLTLASIALLGTITLAQAAPDGDLFRVSCLAQAYGNHIKSVTTNNKTGRIYFNMKNGANLVWNDGIKRNFQLMLQSPDLEDMLIQLYPAGRGFKPHPPVNYDPGRFRNDAFFKAVYGATKSAVKQNLVKVRWMPNSERRPTYVMFNKHNGAAAALRRVSLELDRLPARYKKYLLRLGGTFNWRVIAGTHRLSAHSYGIAIDINTRYSNYWRWGKKNAQGQYTWRNKIPFAIVKIFENNNFIWGGRWYHYDTMHFEYRPEFFKATCRMPSA